MSQLLLRSDISPLTTVVIKVGSRIITSAQSPETSEQLTSLVQAIVTLKQQGIRVLLVSSGAIAYGMRLLGLSKRPADIAMAQACASIGQVQLAHLYARLFGHYNYHAGQVLLTWDDLRDKRRYLNLRNTLFRLLDCDTVPIINENDSVGTDEIKLGDNDTLGAQIAMVSMANLYVILTDVNGLYNKNPEKHPDAIHIPLVERMGPHIHALASGSEKEISVGGMITKLRAAELVTRSGISALIGNGNECGLLDVLSTKTRGTLFLPSTKKLSSRRRWIAFTRHSSGRLVVDSGAERALRRNGKSLLPAGVRSVEGEFKVGDMVTIVNEQGQAIAQGLSNYTSTEARLIAGRRTSDIVKQLGHRSYDELVHRDNLVLV
jgi:glutamate 5-kinase